MTNKASRRDFLKAGTAGLCAWTLGVRGGTAEVSKRPNVLIITTDQQCVTAMSAMGNGWVKTPNIDRMAREGVLFRNAFVTAPSCTPCRSSLLSGQYFFRTGMGAICPCPLAASRAPRAAR